MSEVQYPVGGGFFSLNRQRQTRLKFETHPFALKPRAPCMDEHWPAVSTNPPVFVRSNEMAFPTSRINHLSQCLMQELYPQTGILFFFFLGEAPRDCEKKDLSVESEKGYRMERKRNKIKQRKLTLFNAC